MNPNLPIHPPIPPPPRPRVPPLVSIHLFSTFVCLFLPCKPVHLYHFSRFHIYALIYDICFSLSDLLHSVWESLGPSMVRDILSQRVLCRLWVWVGLGWEQILTWASAVSHVLQSTWELLEGLCGSLWTAVPVSQRSLDRIWPAPLSGSSSEEASLGTSLMAQWVRIRLPMQGTRVRALVWEDPTCRGATKPVCRNYWACALEPASHNYWAHVPQLLKPAPGAHAPNKRSHCNEKPAHHNEE